MRKNKFNSKTPEYSMEYWIRVEVMAGPVFSQWHRWKLRLPTHINHSLSLFEFCDLFHSHKLKCLNYPVRRNIVRLIGPKSMKTNENFSGKPDVRRFLLRKPHEVHLSVKTMICADEQPTTRMCISCFTDVYFSNGSKKWIVHRETSEGFEAIAPPHTPTADVLVRSVSFDLTHGWRFWHLFTFHWPTYFASNNRCQNFNS